VLTGVAISGNGNVIKKELERILKYKGLTVEIQRMWDIRTEVIPVIVEATETISEPFRKYLNNIRVKHDIEELQNTDILGTAHVLRKVLTLTYGTFGLGNNILYPRDMVFPGIYL
jgi:hypothetical protein